jgi:hypothetical protein
MASSVDHRPTCRIIAYNAKLTHYLRTVNVSASQQADAKMHWKEYLQVTAAQASKDKANSIPVFMAAASSTNGLPTIYVNGYTAPS